MRRFGSARSTHRGRQVTTPVLTPFRSNKSGTHAHVAVETNCQSHNTLGLEGSIDIVTIHGHRAAGAVPGQDVHRRLTAPLGGVLNLTGASNHVVQRQLVASFGSP